ncbi:hypothetical protein VA613_14770 [Thiobacillus sedimenti]|uniref:Uncharacterized protein n=1 Tax=Thiobacillus sedimenti TaxID=3110231 RepID=A0ABZ1CJP5_9PROT|nr:hypothetical protein [Thiobacillus sp. SCUT-2]WRS39248.1 hypothetical protein VA613_14770 [Thiobacillus sp. SCUT-2]
MLSNKLGDRLPCKASQHLQLAYTWVFKTEVFRKHRAKGAIRCRYIQKFNSAPIALSKLIVLRLGKNHRGQITLNYFHISISSFEGVVAEHARPSRRWQGRHRK